MIPERFMMLAAEVMFLSWVALVAVGAGLAIFHLAWDAVAFVRRPPASSPAPAAGGPTTPPPAASTPSR